MKKSLLVFLSVFLLLSLLAGCGKLVPTQAAPESGEEQIYVVPDAHVAQGEHDPRIYDMDPNASVLEIPEEPVPMASAYVDVTDGVSEREAEAIAIHHAGLRNDDVRFLHSRLVDAEEPFYYHIEFRSSEVPYKLWISAENGEILLYEKGS